MTNSIDQLPDLTPEDLLRAAHDRRASVRMLAAQFPQIPEEGLSILCRDAVHSVQLAVSGNPSLLPEHMYLLVCHESVKIRTSLARNPMATPEILDVLCGDQHDEVRKAAINNAACPPEAVAMARDLGTLSAKDERTHARWIERESESLAQSHDPLSQRMRKWMTEHQRLRGDGRLPMPDIARLCRLLEIPAVEGDGISVEEID